MKKRPGRRARRQKYFSQLYDDNPQWKANHANAVRYDLDRYYNLDVLIARAKTEHVQSRR